MYTLKSLLMPSEYRRKVTLHSMYKTSSNNTDLLSKIGFFVFRKSDCLSFFVQCIVLFVHFSNFCPANQTRVVDKRYKNVSFGFRLRNGQNGQ